MAINAYKVKNGIRYQAEYWVGKKRLAGRGGFLCKEDAMGWLLEQQQVWEQELLEQERLARMTPEEKRARLTLSEILEEYLDDVQVRMGETSYIYKRAIYRDILDYLGNPDTLAVTVQKLDIRVYIRSIAASKGPKTANRYLIHLRAAWNWALQNDRVDVNPCAGIRKYAEDTAERYVPTEQDLASMLVASTGVERDLLLLLLHTAGRLSEITKLRWSDVNLEHRTLKLWTRKRSGGNREPRILAMSETAYEIIQRRWKARDRHPEFVLHQEGRLLRKDHEPLHSLFHRVCKRAGLKRTITAHCIRHYVATALTDSNKVDVRATQKLLGHKSLNTTIKYLHELHADRGTALSIQRVSDGVLLHSSTDGARMEQKNNSS